MRKNDFAPKNLRDIKSIVAHILERDFNTRNSDKLLAISVWKFISGKSVFTPQDILELPSFETIRRTRQKFQQELLYLPTDQIILKKRKKNEEYVKWYLYRSHVAHEMPKS